MSNEFEKVIAIDGPAGSGKSTLAKRLASSLGVTHIDTGALFRTLGYFLCVENQVSESDIPHFLKNVHIDYIGEKDHLLSLNGRNMTLIIRKPEISRAASIISQNIDVRNFLCRFERQFARENFIVMEGRDIGSVIFPHAFIKFFLTASVEERASRRFEELVDKGEHVDLEVIKEEIEIRDLNDTQRKIAPLIKSEDAFELDSTGKSLEEVESSMIRLIKQSCLEKQIPYETYFN